MRLFVLLGALGALLLSGCAQLEVPDFKAQIRLPASGDCFGIHVVSGREVRLPSAQCEAVTKRAIFLDSENWKLLRESIQRNCQQFQCAQLVGAFDGLFLSIDAALRKIPQ